MAERVAMCGRFAIMTDPSELQEQLDLGDLPEEFTPNPNISPGQLVPVVTDPDLRKVELFKWGLIPSWAKDPKIGYKLFNARAETIIEKPSFRASFSRRRCLIPADGFYEWKMEEGRKYPFLFGLKDHKPFTFAGIWDVWKDHEGKEISTCTIITTEPNPLIAAYHDRMPVILPESERWIWLQQQPVEKLLQMLQAIPAEMMSEPKKLIKL